MISSREDLQESVEGDTCLALSALTTPSKRHERSEESGMARGASFFEPLTNAADGGAGSATDSGIAIAQTSFDGRPDLGVEQRLASSTPARARGRCAAHVLAAALNRHTKRQGSRTSLVATRIRHRRRCILEERRDDLERRKDSCDCVDDAECSARRRLFKVIVTVVVACSSIEFGPLRVSEREATIGRRPLSNSGARFVD